MYTDTINVRRTFLRQVYNIIKIIFEYYVYHNSLHAQGKLYYFTRIPPPPGRDHGNR